VLKSQLHCHDSFFWVRNSILPIKSLCTKSAHGTSGVRRKCPRGGKFRHNRVTSHINFRGRAEVTTILGVPGACPRGKFCKITPKNTHFCAFWKQVLYNTVFTFFIFRVWGGGHGTVASPLRTLLLRGVKLATRKPNPARHVPFYGPRFVLPLGLTELRLILCHNTVTFFVMS